MGEHSALQFETDAFLSHDWGSFTTAYANYWRVRKVNQGLQRHGLKTTSKWSRWQMAHVVETSRVVVVFVTQQYIEDVKSSADKNCKYEFNLAISARTTQNMIAVLLERVKWSGPVSDYLGTDHISVDMTDGATDEKIRELSDKIELIIQSQTQTASSSRNPSSSTTWAEPANPALVSQKITQILQRRQPQHTQEQAVTELAQALRQQTSLEARLKLANECLLQSLPQAEADLLNSFQNDKNAHTTSGMDELIACFSSKPSDTSNRLVASVSVPTLSVTDIIPDGWSLADITKDRNSKAAPLRVEESMLNNIMQRCGKDIFGVNLQNQSTIGGDDGDDPWATTAKPNATPRESLTSPAHVLIDLMHKLSFPARAVVCRQLLDQRLSIPLFTKKPSSQIFCHAQALRYAPVLIGVDKTTNLLSNTDLPRIAVLCDRPARQQQTGELVDKIFGLKLFAASSLLEDVWLGELGLGTCHDQVVIVLSVFGDIQPVLDFVNSWAHLVIVETDNTADAEHKTLRAFPAASRARIRAWTVNASPFSVDGITVGAAPTVLKMSQQFLTRVLTVDKLKLAQQRTPRVALQQLVIKQSNLKCDVINMSDIGKRLGSLSASNVSALIQLQQSFAREQLFLRKANKVTVDHEGRPFARVSAIFRASQEQAWRFTQTSKSLSQPAIQLLLFIIAIDDKSARATALLEFEQTLSQSGFIVDERTTLQPEHIWREIAHIFASDSTHFDFVAQCAARVMLDGFALELVDGEARSFLPSWFDTLVSALNKQMCQLICRDSARVVALSTFGEQSCGKSTLLNVGFGTRLRASVGRCTRGVNFQIIARSGYGSHGTNGADFVVLLDTEGIRAPEFQGTPASLEHDNFLAMLAVIPAEACMMLIRGESVQAMEQIIPLVVLGMESSKEVAEATAAGSATQLFAAFTAVDRNQAKRCEDIATAMTARMSNEVSAAVSIVQGKSIEDGIKAKLKTSLLSAFDRRAITFVGSHRVDRPPLKDEPITDYGQRVHQMLQDSLDGVITSRKAPITLIKWSSKVEMAINCANSARWRAQLSDIKAAHTAKELDQLVLDSEKCVAKSYSEQFDALTKEMRQTTQSSNSDFVDRLKNGVLTTTCTQRGKLETEFQKRQLSAQQQQDRFLRWDNVLSELQQRWVRDLTEYHDCFVSFELVAAKHKKQLQEQIQTKFKCGEFDGLSKSDQDSKFKSLFDDILGKADADNPPTSETVKGQVRTCYANATHLNAADFDNTSLTSKANKMINSWKQPKISQPFSSRSTDVPLEEIVACVLNTVDAKLKGVKRFQDHVVIEMVPCVNNILVLNKVCTDDIKQQINMAVCLFLEGCMEAIQKEWEKTNSIRGRLESSRDVMHDFFVNTLKGLTCADLLAKTLSDGINSTLKDSALCFLSAELANDLVSNANWVTSPTILRAEVDLALVEAAEQGFELVWPSIQDPSRHFSETLHVLIRKHMGKSGTQPAELLQTFASNIKHQLEQATQKTSVEDVLRHLQGSKHTCLSGTATGISKNVFSELAQGSISSVINKVITTINFDLKCKLEDELPPLVVALLKSSKFTTGTSRVTCGIACPFCGLTCERYLGHDTDGTSDDAKLHNCRHQVAGVYGTQVKGTNELFWNSCSTEAQNDRQFWYGDERVPFRQFNSKYPTWKTPAWDKLDDSDENIARDYMFFKFNKEIAQRNNGKPTPPEHLARYNISLDVVKDKLKARAQQ